MTFVIIIDLNLWALPCIEDWVFVHFEEGTCGQAALSDGSMEEASTLWRQIMVENAHGASTLAEYCHL